MQKSDYCISLNGEWETGVERSYTKTVSVPGLVSDPKIINEQDLWYRKTITLPQGQWTNATLRLKGARFCPSIYVNGNKVASSAGGMAPIHVLLNSTDVKPGETIELEIALKSLKDVDEDDASRIPEADRWRSNLSSCIWDDVEINLHGETRISRLIPYSDIINDRLNVRWELQSLGKCDEEGYTLIFKIFDKSDNLIKQEEIMDAAKSGEVCIDLENKLKHWSPEHPNCYKLKAVLLKEENILDIDETTISFKDFKISGINFSLNNNPITLRAGSVVWHRWLRDPEAYKLAFDENWFEENIIKRLKSHGANTLRFHLGMPPERILDLCDRYGLIVQAEWIFFHGMKATKESLVEQWRCWLDLCMRHPCIGIIHAWNETEGDELKTAYNALEELEAEYPPLVIGHKDVIHIHKYWWSLFENIGLYYDSASQFDRPIMVDEFGGNYLDGEGNPGAYPRIKESLMRFLGRNHTKEMRLMLNRDANAKIAEYWRRIGAAGFSPFCILGSPEDGNHHFIGPLVQGNPKPVWSALTAAYSPQSCSLEVWDKNYLPGQQVTLPLYFFNDTDQAAILEAVVAISSKKDTAHYVSRVETSCEIKAYGKEVRFITMTLPDIEGDWLYHAELQNPPASVKHRVVSEWDFRTITPKVSSALTNKRIAVPEWETEVKEFLVDCGINVLDMCEENHHVLVISKATWLRLNKEAQLQDSLMKTINKGCSIVMLDVGPSELYVPGHDLALQSAAGIKKAEIIETDIFGGIKVKFTQMPEPESCIHPSTAACHLWDNLDVESTRIWNGLRGGLIVPAWDMEVEGLGAQAFIEKWVSRGADPEKINGDKYYAYELAGFYAFSDIEDKEAMDELRARVKFLVEDAPALQNAINPDARIKVTNLSSILMQSTNQGAQEMNVLVNCGKSLTRTPVIELGFGEGKGKLILSQLITKGRLADGYGQDGLYGLRKDPVAGQFVINMMEQVIDHV